ncbi:restriction endonuclease subunit S [Pseudomonas aeruginosa]|uniref:restriction endonuclease subunit S n=1 Tax=Pseudomonas aeruginosa TaxID=287 RepID=UPI000F523AB3|nr:restriction endonuclease subunit S [Pseudomonas aeruginosa]
MDAQQFLAEFGHIASAQGGIAQLRQMIYQLAVTGSLISRDDSPEDAGPLLSSIEQERQRLIQAKKYKRMVKLESEPIKRPHGIVLPSTWRWSRLLDIGEINPRNAASDEQLAAFVPMSGVSQLHKGPLTAETKRWGDIKKGYTQFANGDVVLAKITPCFENGKAAVVENLPGDAGIGAGTTELHVVRPLHTGVLPDYIYLFLRSPLFAVEGEKNMTGTAGQKRVPTDYFATRAFPLPPTNEQIRIVDKVDELMALCDQLEQKQKKRRKLQGALRKSTLQAVADAQSPHELKDSWQRLQDNFECLFSEPKDVGELRSVCVELAIRGALSPAGDREILVDADDLLDGLAKRKMGKRVAKLSQVAPPFELPKRWRWVFFDDLLQESEAGWSPKCDAEPRRQGEWGVLKVSAVTWGSFRPNENKRLPPSLDPRPECEVKSGDFLLSRANTAELVARSVIVENDAPDRLLLSDKIVRLVFIDPELKVWANLVNNSQFARAYYRSQATGTSDSMRNVSRQVIHELPIPLPPKCVQYEIIEKLVQLGGLCDSLEKQLGTAALNAERLSGAAVAALIGITLEQEDEPPMKAPQTELIALLRMGTPPDVKAQAPLATILARHNGEMSARDLWQRFGGEIDAFYAQLKSEVAEGWLIEPAMAEVRVKPATETERA